MLTEKMIIMNIIILLGKQDKDWEYYETQIEKISLN